jgi:hypothetical protein
MLECFGVFSEVTEFTRPMSRRQATNRRELLLPSLMPNRRQTVVIFDPSAPGAPPAAAINGNGAEPAREWTRQSIHCRAAKQVGPPTESASPELIARNHLLARLVFQRIRPRSRSAVMGGPSCSPEELQRARTPIALSNIASPLQERAGAPVPPSVETLFTQLARRRLRGRATEETS